MSTLYKVNATNNFVMDFSCQSRVKQRQRQFGRKKSRTFFYKALLVLNQMYSYQNTGFRNSIKGFSKSSVYLFSCVF